MLVAHSTNSGLMQVNDDDTQTARMAVQVSALAGLMVLTINT